MLSRRKALKFIALGSASLAIPPALFANNSQMRKAVIPSTGEKIGMVGVGTWQTFDIGNVQSERAPLNEVLEILLNAGGSVIDSSPMYGRSEEVVGTLTNEITKRDTFFYATKVWTTGESNGISQMSSSMKKMKRDTMDLMQIHNLQDWKTHLKTLYKWKEEGKIRYIGLTHYTNSAHQQLEQLIKSEKIDFIQVNYSIGDRNAEKLLLPTAQDKGVAVLINRPFATGALFNLTRGLDLPPWCADFDCKSWGQFFLKYILSNPAVTCAIPGTSKPHHMQDNVLAGMGELPDEKQRLMMLEFLSNL